MLGELDIPVKKIIQSKVFFFAVLGFELRDLCLKGRYATS
jgi:hypothetical protein